MVFLRTDLEFIMRIFWPNRSDAKGFSIERLSRKYREKISSLSSNEFSNHSSDNINLKSNQEDSKNIQLTCLAVKRGHWANRDFSEYRDAA